MIFLHSYWGILLTHAPIGPSHWTAKNWVGLFLQILIFFLALFFITKLADLEAEEKNSTETSTPTNTTTPKLEITPTEQAKTNEVEE